jgi:NADH pyrophosphatase NudC (nudix superfamily)
MAFCSNCGHVLTRRWLVEQEREREVCESCRTVHYANPKVLVACLVHCRDRIVLARRGTEPARGFWFIPTGYVEAGETLEEAMARELKEEVGLEVPAQCMLLYGVSSLPDINEIYVGFRAQLTMEPKLVLGQESLEARFFSEDETATLTLAFDEFARRMLRNFFRRLRDDDFQVASNVLRTRR